MSGHNRHHYLPRFIIDRFTDDDGMLHVLDRRRAPPAIRRLNPKDTFVEKHLYSEKLPDGRRDRSLEIELGRFEGRVARLTNKIIGNAHARRPAGLTDDERIVWDEYVSLQWRRVPEMHASVMDDAKFANEVAESVAEFEATFRPMNARERVWLNDAQAQSRLRHNVQVDVVARGSMLVPEVLGQRGMLVAMPERTDKQFILASRPILRAGPKDATLHHPELEAWFVIAPDVAVTPWGMRGVDQFVTLTTKGVRRLNELLSRQSHAIASGSAALIASLSHPR